MNQLQVCFNGFSTILLVKIQNDQYMVDIDSKINSKLENEHINEQQE